MPMQTLVSSNTTNTTNTTNATNLLCLGPELNESSEAHTDCAEMPTITEYGSSNIVKYVVAPLRHVPQLTNQLIQLHKFYTVFSPYLGLSMNSARWRWIMDGMSINQEGQRGIGSVRSTKKITNDHRLKYALAQICERTPQAFRFISHKMIEEQMGEDENMLGPRGPRWKGHYDTALQAMVTAGFVTCRQYGVGIYVRDHTRSWLHAAQLLAGEPQNYEVFCKEIDRMMGTVQRELLKKNAEIVELRERIQQLSVANNGESEDLEDHQDSSPSASQAMSIDS